MHRLWRTWSGAVPDTSAVPRGWTLADAIALSAGLVWRDELGLSRTGRSRPAWFAALREAASEHGVQAVNVRMIASSSAERFVHRTNPGTLVRPYHAIIDLGGLAGEEALTAIGQSRHLGGGLLIPVDGMEGEKHD